MLDSDDKQVARKRYKRIPYQDIRYENIRHLPTSVENEGAKWRI